MSRSDLEELGDLLEEGQAALVVIAESRIAEQLEKELARASKLIEKEIDADARELEKELERAARCSRLRPDLRRNRRQSKAPSLVAVRRGGIRSPAPYRAAA